VGWGQAAGPTESGYRQLRRSACHYQSFYIQQKGQATLLAERYVE
jgi:hypothetical protein